MAPKSASASGDKNLKSKSPAEFFQDNKGTSSALSLHRATLWWRALQSPPLFSLEHFLNEMCEWTSNPQYEGTLLSHCVFLAAVAHQRSSSPV